MLVIDTSAIMAVLQQEPEADRFAEAIDQASERLISTVSLLEAGILCRSRKGLEGVQRLDALVHAAGMTAAPFDHDQSLIAREAFARFGKGRHEAGLNFGDCAAYALAAVLGAPLLFKGNDFSATDIEAAAC